MCSSTHRVAVAGLIIDEVGLCPASSAGTLPPADGSQASGGATRARLLPHQQRLVAVQRRRPGRQPVGTEQPVVLERGARPLQPGHLHWSHDTGEFGAPWRPALQYTK